LRQSADSKNEEGREDNFATSRRDLGALEPDISHPLFSLADPPPTRKFRGWGPLTLNDYRTAADPGSIRTVALALALQEDYPLFGSQMRQPQSGPTEPETTMQDVGATNSLQAPQRWASCATVWKWTLSLETFTGEG